jgi:hypothetical protein
VNGALARKHEGVKNVTSPLAFRIAESRDPLRAARDAFDALGCESWGDKALRELRASGESSRRRARPKPAIS